MASTHTNFLEHDRGGSRELILEFAHTSDVTDACRAKYRTHLSAFAEWLLAGGADSALPVILRASTADVHGFMTSLRQPDRAGGPLSASTRKNYLCSLRSFYRYCVDVRLIASDPSAAVRTPRVPHMPGVHLSADELRSLLSVNTDPRDRIQTYLMVYTGARSGELRNLRWQDVDFTARTILLYGKGGRVRVVDIHPALGGELRRWFVHQEVAAERSAMIAAVRRDPSTDFVLLTKSGKPVPASTFSRQLKRRACLAGLHVLERSGREYRSAVSPHALRRSFATLLLNDGHPIDAVADILGHASLNTTRDHYAFSADARRRATIEAFAV